MKLVRYGPVGQEKPGLIDPQGVLRDASAWTADWTGEALSPAALQALGNAPAWLQWPEVTGNPRLGCPVGQVGKLVGVGLNYVDRARAVGAALPDAPALFLKAPSALCGAQDILRLPPQARQVDGAVELGVVIGAPMQYVPECRAMECLAGYVLVNNLAVHGPAEHGESALTGGHGASLDGFAPAGPWLLTADALPDPHNLALWLELNGEVVQDSHTRQMIFQLPRLLAYISEWMTLEPGDIVLTGTPAGTGHTRRPQPRFLQPGDVMALGAEGLGEQRVVCCAWERRGRKGGEDGGVSITRW